MITDYTDGLALRTQIIFEYLPRANNGLNDRKSEKMANAATMAGMAFANAFLGVCHSMAHKLGAFHHLPHGVANALMIDEVIGLMQHKHLRKWNFSQYDHPIRLPVMQVAGLSVSRVKLMKSLITSLRCW